MGIGPLKMEVGGQLAVAQAQDDLHEAGDAGGGFQVAEVGFNGAQPEGALGVAAGAEARARARTSMGSPRGVPVPWAST